MDKKYLYVAGDSYSAKGGNAIPKTTWVVNNNRDEYDDQEKFQSDMHDAKISNRRVFLDALNLERNSQWSNQLAKKLDLKLLHGGAVVGGSNERSINRLRNFLMSDTRAKDSIVIWQLTTIFRDIIFSRKHGMWKSISQGSVGYWNRCPSEEEWNNHVKFIETDVQSDLVDAYKLIEEIVLLHSLSVAVGAKFIVFDGFQKITDLLDLSVNETIGGGKLVHLHHNVDQVKEVELSQEDSEEGYEIPILDEKTRFQYIELDNVDRHDEYYHEVFLDLRYHRKKVELYKTLVESGIIVYPFGYETLQEAMNDGAQYNTTDEIESEYGNKLSTRDCQGAYVCPKKTKVPLKTLWKGKAYEEIVTDLKIMYSTKDIHPGHQTRELLACFLKDIILEGNNAYKKCENYEREGTPLSSPKLLGE
jgi:hypothetical protein